MDWEAQGSRAIKALASSGLYSSRALRLPVHIANSGIYSVYYEKCRVLTSKYNTGSNGSHEGITFDLTNALLPGIAYVIATYNI